MNERSNVSTVKNSEEQRENSARISFLADSFMQNKMMDYPCLHCCKMSKPKLSTASNNNNTFFADHFNIKGLAKENRWVNSIEISKFFSYETFSPASNREASIKCFSLTEQQSSLYLKGPKMKCLHSTKRS